MIRKGAMSMAADIVKKIKGIVFKIRTLIVISQKAA